MQLEELRRLHGVRRCSLTSFSEHVQALLCHQREATVDTVQLERLWRLHRMRPRSLTSPTAIGEMRVSLCLQVATLADAVQLGRLWWLHSVLHFTTSAPALATFAPTSLADTLFAATLLDEYRTWCARMPVSASGISNC